MTFLDDLRTYLQATTTLDIYTDFLPDLPDDCVGLFCWDSTVGAVNDGSGVRYVQVQVRSINPETAYMTACALCNALDSGLDETIIHLTNDRWCVGRTRKRPVKLSLDETHRTIYYFETALWGDIKE